MRARRFSGLHIASCASLCAVVAAGCTPKARQASALKATPAPTALGTTEGTRARDFAELLNILKAAQPTPRPSPYPTPMLHDKLGELRSVALAPDGRSVALGTLGVSYAGGEGRTFGWVFRRDVRNNALLNRWRVPTGISDLALSPDGKKLATVGDTKVWLWSWPAGKLLRSANSPSAKSMQCDFSPDGQTLAVADYNLTLFDVATLKRKRALPLPDPPFVNNVIFAPDGRHLATSHDDIEVDLLLWDLRTRRSRELDAGGPMVFSSDGHWLAAKNGDEIVLFDGRSGRRVKSFRLKPSGGPDDSSQDLTPLTFSPDARYLLGYSDYHDDSVPHIWDVRSGKHLKTLPHLDGILLWSEARVLLACTRDSVRRVPLSF